MPCLAVILVNISVHRKSNSVTISKRLRKVLKIKRGSRKKPPLSHARAAATLRRVRPHAAPFRGANMPRYPRMPPDFYIFHPIRRTKNRLTDPCRAHLARKTVCICVKSSKIRTSTPTACPRWGTRPPVAVLDATPTGRRAPVHLQKTGHRSRHPPPLIR